MPDRGGLVRRSLLLGVLTVGVGLVAFFLQPEDAVARAAAVAAVPAGGLALIGSARGWYDYRRPDRSGSSWLAVATVAAVAAAGLATDYRHGFLVFLAVALDVSAVSFLVVTTMLRRGASGSQPRRRSLGPTAP